MTDLQEKLIALANRWDERADKAELMEVLPARARVYRECAHDLRNALPPKHRAPLP